MLALKMAKSRLKCQSLLRALLEPVLETSRGRDLNHFEASAIAESEDPSSRVKSSRVESRRRATEFEGRRTEPCCAHGNFSLLSGWGFEFPMDQSKNGRIGTSHVPERSLQQGTSASA